MLKVHIRTNKHPDNSLTQLIIYENLLCETFTILRNLSTQKQTADKIPQNKILAEISNINVHSQLFSEKKNGNIWPRPDTVSIRMSQWSCNREHESFA